jgi:hypothetical protein
LNAVQALGALDIRSDVVSDWLLPRVRLSRSCRNYVRMPRGALQTPSPETWRWLSQYCFAHDVDVVIPADLAAARAALSPSAQCCDIPFFPLPSAEVLELLHDKWAFYRLLCELGLPTPSTRLLTPDMPTGTLDLEMPVMVKPPASEGSDGVHKIDSLSALEALRAQAANRDKAWLVQQFIPGRDIDLSVLGMHGALAAHTIQQDIAPGVKQFLENDRMLEVGREIIHATRFHGLAHFDMRIDERDQKPYVIECNPRIWGSLQYSVWAGVNFLELGCRLAMGRSLPAFTPTFGEISYQGIAPLRLAKALLRGRTAPMGMTGGTLASWRQALRDPLPEILGHLTEDLEGRRRNQPQQLAAAPSLRDVPLRGQAANDNAAAPRKRAI